MELRRLLVALGLVGVAGGVQAQANSEPVVRGRVVATDGRAVAAAEVGLVDSPVRATTDSAGRFLLRVPSPGAYAVFARAIGFQPETRTIVIGAGGTDEQVFVLVLSAAILPDLVAEARWAKPGRLAHTTKYDAFYFRRRQGFGTFLTREQIDRSTAFRTFELLRGISGVQVAWNPPGVPGTTVRFSRCLDFPPRISVWVDGQKIPFRAPAPPPGAGRALTPEEAARGGASLEEVLAWRSATWSQWLELFDFVRPADIEAVEVFRGIGQIPAEFRDDSCAAVAIWTREGGKAPPPADR